MLIGSWTDELDKERAGRVLSGEDPFDEVAFAAGDAHGGGTWDEDPADLDADLTGTPAELVAAGH